MKQDTASTAAKVLLPTETEREAMMVANTGLVLVPAGRLSGDLEPGALHKSWRF